ncbi:hypothetical protein CYG48_12715 [Neorhizobium sp. SOG26]|uniref:hypothetical protein n=1 Tax=Neorhizobium sp. SOG26 TaxID=2060726 RepID=UPI000E57D8F2|nr:hypothetical protein [Neorhizobium sp. SOG26]AXV16473.1 hypothetical protein CYG48_12715 [Neorhizobium sp. SOG26]
MNQHVRFQNVAAPVKPHLAMFHFRVHCAGGVLFDVLAARREDAMAYVRKRNCARIYRVEQFAEVKQNARLR